MTAVAACCLISSRKRTLDSLAMSASVIRDVALV